MNDTSAEQKKSRAPIAIAVLAVAAVGAGIWWWTARGYESTDDAFIQADVTMIAPRVSGTVTKVYVNDNQVVVAGAVLFELDAEDYEARLRQAQANLAAAQAQTLSAQADLDLTRTPTSSAMKRSTPRTKSPSRSSNRRRPTIAPCVRRPSRRWRC